jgi:hypothetical protein
MVNESQVIETINELCISVQKMNLVLAAIIENIPMDDDQRQALQEVGNELGAAFAVLQSQCMPQGKPS